MPTAEKERSIEQAREWYSKASGVVFTDYKGLNVKEMQGLRRELRKKGGEIHVLKNTLFRIAAGKDTDKLPDELHNGTTAFAFVFENESDVAKALVDFARTSRKLIVKGGFFSGRAVSAQQVEQISQLPPRDVLLSQVIGAIAAPISSLIGTIEALYADPIRTIGAVADKVAEESGAPPQASGAPESAVQAEPAVESQPEAQPEAAPSEPGAEAAPPEAPSAEEAPVEPAPEPETAE